MNFFANMFKTDNTPATNPNPAAPAAPTPGTGLSAPKETGEKLPEATPVNPLDAYKKMFDDSVKSSDISAPSFKLDPTVLSKVSGEMDFTKGINEELMTKALGGDAKSLLDVMQSVGRNAYSASLEHTTSLTDAHLTNRAAFERQSIDKGVKTQLTHDALSSAPNYSHPVVKAELNRVASTFAQANPDASPKEVAEAAQKYIMDLQSALSPTKATDANGAAGGGGETDWSKYLI